MKFLSLVVVVAIVYFVYGKRLAPDRNESVNNAMAEYEKTVPAKPAGAAASKSSSPTTAETASAAPAQGSSSIRRPIDRTRAVLEQVKTRNGDGEF